jgi:hypothetical protein
LEKKVFLKDDMVDIILNKKYPVSDKKFYNGLFMIILKELQYYGDYFRSVNFEFKPLLTKNFHRGI